LGEEVAELEAGGADLLHFDVMDGQFVPNLTLGVIVLEALRPLTELPFDTHLMVLEPDRHIEPFILSGSGTVSVHPEACTHLLRTLQLIRSFEEVDTGVALNPATSPVLIEPILDYIDQVTVMTVNPGFAGQPFLEPMLRKIEGVRLMLDARGLDTRIAVDGGVSPDNIRSVVDLGVDIVIGGGSSVFLNGRSYTETIGELR
ncbi:MAG: ribulose-phosphate 3-epimerase, partial [Armatimonadetes bacterium]|nr:ribulose-phosphate 3-epimerase [Armatimonadota bacterium]